MSERERETHKITESSKTHEYGQFYVEYVYIKYMINEQYLWTKTLVKKHVDGPHLLSLYVGSRMQTELSP